MNKILVYSGLIALAVSISSIGIFSYFTQEKNPTVKIEHINHSGSKPAIFSLDEEGNAEILDFNQTAEQVIDGVVHIMSTQINTNTPNQSRQYQSIPSPFRDFFGDEFNQFFGPQNQRRSPQGQPRRAPARVGTGSGVIISENGYIVTNNHVVANADDIEVSLHDNRTYKATIVGTDPTTDLALLRIKEKNLPIVPFVNSDQVKVGQWVLAVGNPFSLNSTVTAGIVSATGRNINILKEQYAVENFIQTDAAINPGNSGGALVNLEGGLIGINTAIASPTGSYSGYGFAVPANIVEKVVEDLMKYGVVQRGVLGVMIRSVNGNFAREKDLDITQGVYVDSLLENSAAAKAGIKVGDVILSVDEVEVNSSPELQGMIARHRPGEEVVLRVNREGKEKKFTVTLNNREGNTEMVNKEQREILSILGADLKDIDNDLAKKLDIKGGVKVNKLYAGKIRKYTQMREGFIITRLDGRNISSVDELISLLEKKKGGIMLEGVYEDIPGEYYYAFGL